MRIVSLVPSITELLYDLGLDEEVIGITKFCVLPEHWFKTKTRIGGTKNLDIEKIKSLYPDLVIANKEENVKQQVEELAAQIPVYTSDIHDLTGALEMIKEIGRITGKAKEANLIVEKIESAFLSLQPPPQPSKACYLIWREPYMTVGGDTFINDMMERCGFDNIFKGKQRYPQVEIEKLPSLGCEYLLLSSEPFPFAQKHVHEMEAKWGEAAIIQTVLVDGQMFSWYGSHLLKSARYFNELLASLSPGGPVK